MNPTVSQRTIDEAYARDAAAASAEFGAEFRTDVESFIPPEAVDAAIIPGRIELPFVPGNRYAAFVDPSGGTSDSMTLAIAHVSDQPPAVLDLIREVRPPFSPEAVAREFAAVARSYGISEVVGDRYGGEWPREQFRKHHVEYKPSEHSKSEIYLELLPAISSAAVELLDHSRLIAQLCGLERRTARGGRDSVDHGPGAHDDVVNAAAGALCLALRSLQVGGIFEVYREAAEAIRSGHASEERSDPVEVAKENAGRGMQAAIATDNRVANVFGSPRRPITGAHELQGRPSPATVACPECGSIALTRSAVQGPSGDLEEKCACGWSAISPRPKSSFVATK